MKSTDSPAFAMALAGCLTEIYDKAVTPALREVWERALDTYNLADVQAALAAHIADPDAGRFPPKPADIIRRLPMTNIDDGHPGHPGPEEAWGLLLRFVTDERETGVYTEPMRQGWEACDPILKLGDEVGARMCFLETYRKALQRAKEARLPPRWQVSMGSDLERRKSALWAAVDAKRLSVDYVSGLLPAPPANLEHVAGLLECGVTEADPNPDQPSFSQRLRDLAAQMHSDREIEVSAAMQTERAQREALEARKADIAEQGRKRLSRAA